MGFGRLSDLVAGFACFIFVSFLVGVFLFVLSNRWNCPTINHKLAAGDGGKRFRISLITFVVPSAVETSAWIKWLSVFSAGTERAVMMTIAPPCWKRSAIALPAPLVPPVTKTRLPLNSFMSNELPDDEMFIGGFVITVN